MRQSRWFELVKDYYCAINYHSKKANSVVDALSRKSHKELFRILTIPKPVLLYLQRLGIKIKPYRIIERFSIMTLQHSLLEWIKKGHSSDEYLTRLKSKMVSWKKVAFQLLVDGIIRFKSRLYVPDDAEIRKTILRKAHCSPYSIHLGIRKMYKRLKIYYWWSGIKMMQ